MKTRGRRNRESPKQKTTANQAEIVEIVENGGVRIVDDRIVLQCLHRVVALDPGGLNLLMVALLDRVKDPVKAGLGLLTVALRVDPVPVVMDTIIMVDSSAAVVGDLVAFGVLQAVLLHHIYIRPKGLSPFPLLPTEVTTITMERGPGRDLVDDTMTDIMIDDVRLV
jgi:hypothetical protein